jgi:cell division protein DivIC
MFAKIPAFFKSFYFITTIVAMVWMIFFDPNDLINQIRLKQQHLRLEEDKAYYIQKIEEVNQEREALLSNKKKLEKFARENYLMKKPSEDVYVLVEE